MANTSKRISRLLNKPSVHKTAVAVRMPKAMRRSAFKESQTRIGSAAPDDDVLAEKRSWMDQNTPDWRTLTHTNGAPIYAPSGMLLDDHGNRSIFDDVDE